MVLILKNFKLHPHQQQVHPQLWTAPPPSSNRVPRRQRMVPSIRPVEISRPTMCPTFLPEESRTSPTTVSNSTAPLPSVFCVPRRALCDLHLPEP